MNIHLGYEVGTGDPVVIPLRHLAVTGQTQESGKTTTLEALANRSSRDVIAFVTKRGEASFAGGHRLAPYFRDRADWQFVDQLLEAQLREKNKFLRPWIIRICRTTRTLADVHSAVKTALKKAKGMNEGVYTQLDAYLELIVPEIARARLATSIELKPGLNVMDVSAFPPPMQMLFVQSAIDWVNSQSRGVVTIVPEAWEFVPEGKGSPVKTSAVALVRKGAAIGNFIWVDSQDMAGVDKTILRGCAVWLVGAQREANEIKRNLANIPASIRRPKPTDIAQLGRGEFFACWKDRTVKTYVQPAWMLDDQARRVSKRELSIDQVVHHGPSRPNTIDHSESESDMSTGRTPAEQAMNDQSRDARLDRVVGLLERFVTAGQGAQAAVNEAIARPTSVVAPSLAADEEQLYQRFKTRLMTEAPAAIKVLAVKPEIEVAVQREILAVASDTLRGRLARFIADGLFDDGMTGGVVQKELGRRGFNVSPGSLYPELETLCRLGFLTVEQDTDARNRPVKSFRAVPGMKVNVRG